MDLALLFAEEGGLVSRARLEECLGRALADRAVAEGAVVRAGQGRYVLPHVDAAAATAHGLRGVLGLESAALHHGWEVLHAPDLPHVVVPRKRRIAVHRRAGVHLHRRDLAPVEVSGIATSHAMTLEMCLRTLPWADALAVADSALRHGVLPATLRVAAAGTGPGTPQARRVAAAARGEAANPFESGLRAIALDVPGLRVVPQVRIHTSVGTVRPDLVDLGLRLVLEADSFAWHGDRAALRRDCRRYNALVEAGFLVLRFSWEDVLLRPEEAAATLARVVRLAA